MPSHASQSVVIRVSPRLLGVFLKAYHPICFYLFLFVFSILILEYNLEVQSFFGVKILLQLQLLQLSKITTKTRTNRYTQKSLGT